MQNFKNPIYLKKGNHKQRQAHKELNELNLFKKLVNYQPVLCGTIPIEIDTEESDLDIICFCEDLEQFSKDIVAHFGAETNFVITRKMKRSKETVIARFETKSFLVELFGQNLPIEKQMAYRHMLIEAKIMENMGEEFRKKVIALKRTGLKTEPAFAKLLGLEGDPYLALLDLE